MVEGGMSLFLLAIDLHPGSPSLPYFLGNQMFSHPSGPPHPELRSSLAPHSAAVRPCLSLVFC